MSCPGRCGSCSCDLAAFRFASAGLCCFPATVCGDLAGIKVSLQGQVNIHWAEQGQQEEGPRGGRASPGRQAGQTRCTHSPLRMQLSARAALGGHLDPVAVPDGPRSLSLSETGDTSFPTFQPGTWRNGCGCALVFSAQAKV